jgi:hypothetical protein
MLQFSFNQRWDMKIQNVQILVMMKKWVKHASVI